MFAKDKVKEKHSTKEKFHEAIGLMTRVVLENDAIAKEFNSRPFQTLEKFGITCKDVDVKKELEEKILEMQGEEKQGDVRVGCWPVVVLAIVVVAFGPKHLEPRSAEIPFEVNLDVTRKACEEEMTKVVSDSQTFKASM